MHHVRQRRVIPIGRWLLLIALLVAPLRAAEPIVKKPEVSLVFETQVRPILKANCFHCHGDEEQHEGKLDLRLVRTIAKGGESGPALVVGKHQDSLLWRRISANEMPPGEKKLSPKERAAISAWIDQGARTARPEPEALAADEWTEDERAFWSFQPIRRPPQPSVKNPQQVRTPIDGFLLARLEHEELGFSPEADRRTLVRRAYFDLLGLPPTPDEVAAFLADSRPDAYERLIDRLLESPHYGERWARHWLDVAGYADSDGYSEKDFERKYAYKYRDYIIQALNADRPWDELIREQLAGDEMLTPPFKNLSAEQIDKLVATGFLRMAPDGTGDAAADANVARNDCLAETIKIVSTSLLGLSVGCAQCHSHRYDPISHVDYYRLRAIFEPAYDWKNWRVPGKRLISLWTDAQRQLADDCDAESKRLEKERLIQWEALIDQVRETEIAGLPEELKTDIRTAAKTLAAKRTPEQKALLTDHPKANVPLNLLARNMPKEYNAIRDQFEKQIEEARARRPVDAFAQCLTEVPGQVPATFLFGRGDFNAPKQIVEPGELSVFRSTLGPTSLPLDDEQVPTTGRRLAYARHLTDGRHPLVARVLVNRVWLHHFGRGIVGTPTDFGRLGERPSHPELLDWLADEWMRGGWRLKPLHRLIMTSTAYRQSSRRNDRQDAIDPENRLLGRMSVRRLEAETIRDAILFVSGRLTQKLYGPSVPVAPDEAGQIIIGVDTRDGAGRPTGKKVPLGAEEFRRSLYIQVRRTMPLALLETFDAAALTPNCAVRSSSTVAPQSLMLMNNEFVVQQANTFAARIALLAADDLAAQAQLAWRAALSSEPTDVQLAAAVTYLTEQAANFPAPAESDKVKVEPRQRALASYCQALLSSNAFLYVD